MIHLKIFRLLFHLDGILDRTKHTSLCNAGDNEVSVLAPDFGLAVLNGRFMMMEGLLKVCSIVYMLKIHY